MPPRARTTPPPRHVVVNLDAEDRKALYQIVTAERLTISDCLRRLIRDKAQKLAAKAARAEGG